MADSNQFPDEWLQVLFSDDTYACIAATAENRTMLDALLDKVQGGAVGLPCLDGAVMMMRKNAIVGYVFSTPDIRDISREWTKLRKAEDPDWAGDS